jgi:hypothetical protein
LALIIFLASPRKVDSTIQKVLLTEQDTLHPVVNLDTIEVLEEESIVDELFERIAFCESGNNPGAQNPHSTAGGRFQFIIGSWNYYGEQLWGEELIYKDRFDYDDNTELAWYVYQTVGTSPWDASEHCWNML